MQVLEYEVHNVLKVTDLTVPMEGRHLVLVGGGNAQGKTSALQALVVALCGKRGCDYPDVPLKDGENSGRVTVKLGGNGADDGLTVERLFKRKKGGGVEDKLVVKDSADRPVSKPQDILNGLYRHHGLDPRDFESQDKGKLRQMVMELAGLDKLFAETEAEYARLNDERRDVNRDIKKLEPQLNAKTFHADAPPEEVSVKDLLDEKDRRSVVNQQNRDLREAAITLQDRVAQLGFDVDELERQLHEKRSEESAAIEALTHAEAAVADLVDEDTTEIVSKIENAEDVNRKVRENKGRAELAGQLKAEQDKSESMTAQMEAIREKQQRALKDATWPVDGMSVDEDGVTYNGLPVSQSSESQRMKLWCRLAAAMNPELKLLVLKDAPFLDDGSLAELDGLLEELNCQALIEFGTRNAADEERCQVVLRDGVGS